MTGGPRVGRVVPRPATFARAMSVLNPCGLRESGYSARLYEPSAGGLALVLIAAVCCRTDVAV